MVWVSRYENPVVEGFGAQGLIRTPSFRIGRRPDECPPPSYSFLTQAPSRLSRKMDRRNDSDYKMTPFQVRPLCILGRPSALF